MVGDISGGEKEMATVTQLFGESVRRYFSLHATRVR